MATPIYILGGFQTDFARNYSREGAGLFELIKDAVDGALGATQVEAKDIGSAHVGNFTGELFSGQGHLGGLVASLRPEFSGLPTARHEAACASGSMAILAAAAELEAERYDVSCVIGVEQMRNVSGDVAADHLAAAAWRGREGQDARYLWPHMFSNLADEYERRYGLDYRHLMAIAVKNFTNAKHNPNAQSRKWSFGETSFTADDKANPVVEGRMRRQDCGQITDGSAAVILASARFAERHAKSHGVSLDDIPSIKGWGHRTAPMLMADKLESSTVGDHLFPAVRETIRDAQRRAGLAGSHDLDAIELHDCFTITEYMLTEHFDLAAPGEAWRVIEAGTTAKSGAIPVNPSGGLIGSGHPVGATGVRMVLDAYKQVTDRAGEYQVPGARTVQTLNIGGSATTSASFVVGR